ncbi:MAG TPA: discoidin domain-containing protein [Actinocrinis sp.]|nr:discoidin domain-containing protein [Actinocrinis sp.]
MAVSRPGFQFAGATLLDPLAETTVVSVLRTPVPRVGTVPHIVTFPRQRARYVRVALEPTGHLATPHASVRTLSVVDASVPTVDLALGKRVIASCAATTPSSAVDGNPCTRWSPAPHDDRPWIQLDLGDSACFDHVCVALDATDPGLALRVTVSDDGAQWTEPEASDDLFTGLRIDLGATVPPCSADCEPLHVQVDPTTWQVYAVNHTAMPVAGASISARIYEPFGKQLNHIEQQDLVVEPLSVAAGFVISRPVYSPPTYLVHLQLHDADGSLLSERDCWIRSRIYRPAARTPERSGTGHRMTEQEHWAARL